MKRFGWRLMTIAVLATAFGLSHRAIAGPIYVVSADGTNGKIYKYDDMDDLKAQTPSNITGDLVATVAGYHNDQAVTLDYDTGFVYRIGNGGSVFRYNTLADWLTDNTANRTNVSIGSNPFSNANLKRVNDASYDGATGGYYAVGSTAANSSTPGDLLIYNTLNDFRAATPNTVLEASYQLARVMFWNREAVYGTTVNNQNIHARYFQISNAGRLEGFQSVATYAAGANNRINLGLEGAFGGAANTTGFNAIVAMAVPVPEPASVLMILGTAIGLLAVRRR